jgi:hypothetical protein
LVGWFVPSFGGLHHVARREAVSCLRKQAGRAKRGLVPVHSERKPDFDVSGAQRRIDIINSLACITKGNLTYVVKLSMAMDVRGTKLRVPCKFKTISSSSK